MGIDTKYKILFGVLIVLLFGVGIFIGIKVSKIGSSASSLEMENKVDENVDIYNEDENTVQTLSKKYDIELVYEDKYTLCNETITKKETIYDTTLEELKQREEKTQEADGKVYKIKEESNERLVYSRNISTNCPNHFKAILEDNVIKIYRVIDEKSNELYRKIDTQDKLIREDVKEELEEGVLLNSYQELNLFIEDLES